MHTNANKQKTSKQKQFFGDQAKKQDKTKNWTREQTKRNWN